MKKIVILLCFLGIMVYGTKSYAFGGCESDCQKCHSLSAEEAAQILSKVRPAGAKVVWIKMSPLKGLWEVAVEEKDRKGVVYVGFSKKYVVGGPIYEIDAATNTTHETVETLNRPADRYVNVSGISLGDSIVMGNPGAANKVVVFTDPDCPFCQKLHGELKKIIAERKDIVFYLKLMPLKFHPDSYWKSQSILCAKSLALMEDNFEKKPIPRPDCDTKVPDENLRLAADLGVTGTPTIIMPDGMVLVGGRDAAKLTRLILAHSGKHAVR
jgi:thiol:disulfide interchange protein DsbC